jgi:hypothetical protein
MWLDKAEKLKKIIFNIEATETARLQTLRLSKLKSEPSFIEPAEAEELLIEELQSPIKSHRSRLASQLSLDKPPSEESASYPSHYEVSSVHTE